MDSRLLSLRDGLFEVDLCQGGAGRPLLYLHGTFGRREEELLGLLARGHRVVAPCHPGYGGSTGAEQLTDLPDLIYHYLDLLDALELDGVTLVGHGLGGMVATELAAVQPHRFTRLILIAPLGLWKPAHPVMDIFSAEPEALAAALFHDPTSAQARAMLSVPPEGDGYAEWLLDRARSMAAAASYLWPIPNRGLTRRLHRVRTPTVLVWGARDGVCPLAYAGELQARIAGAQLTVLPDAGHMVTIEQPARIAELVAP